MLTKEEKTEIYEGVYIGTITLFNLPENLYQSSADVFRKSVYKGYGKTLNRINTDTKELIQLNGYVENTNHFSAAKTFDQIKESQRLILNPDGSIKPFNEYLTEVKEIDALYNKNWLRTEAQTAITQSQNASIWNEFEKNKEAFPMLVYRTQGDERVRHSHAALDGFTAPVNDNYWSSITPQNDFGCRCWIEPLDKGSRSTKEWESKRVTQYNKEIDTFNAKTRGKKANRIKDLKGVPTGMFKGNVGKDGFIFKAKGVNSHPYFKVAAPYTEWKKQNFGMDINYGL